MAEYINNYFPSQVVSDAEKLSYDYGLKVAKACLLYTSPSPRDGLLSRMPSSA